MPLSEDEQRILQDIERSFYESDPGFARSVGTNALYRHARRNCKLAAVGFALSLVLLLTTFASVAPLAFLGFVGMVASAAVFVQNTKRLATVGMKDVAESEKARQAAQRVKGARRRLNDRLKRDDED